VKPLSIYLNDHLMGATLGVNLFRRSARNQANRPWGPMLQQLSEEVDEDRETLVAIMGSLGIPRRQYKILAGGLGERLARAKFNGGLIRRSPLSDLVELEGMYLGVIGKASGWQALLQVTDTMPGLDREQIQRLADRASSQATRLEDARRRAAEVLAST
jgi:hypothetical protein